MPPESLWGYSSTRMCGEGMRTRSNMSDRKSTRLNSSHSQISYAVFCLKKKKNIKMTVNTLACVYAPLCHHLLCCDFEDLFSFIHNDHTRLLYQSSLRQFDCFSSTCIAR